ncbi:flavodoxin family protein [Streptomyces sp. NBC_01262]|uniref:flavodoxin family protein n=1 Tax=Streptomyces sp. NBC_01262 TaxID=2903803 RepID=UPI002E31FCC1|nr:flavodoxin domain-containing protein [Streptomyces sp. NBC_01262]
MRVVIVYESLFGNTREVAEAVRDGVRRARPDADVDCLRVSEAGPEQIGTADLLVVGGPTHMRGMTTRMSRKMGLKTEENERTEDPAAGHEPDQGAEGPGIRDWFHDIPRDVHGAHAAAFDTRADFRLAGGAAPAIARRLRGHGYDVVTEPEGFIVEDSDGPLRQGEATRAAEWGAGMLDAVGS